VGHPAGDPEAVAVLLYTSGTSGRPKGAMLSHRALLANLDQIGRIEPPLLGASDVVLAPLPMFHVFGLNAALGLAIANRATLVTMDRFDAASALVLAGAHAVTIVVGAPAMFAALAVRLAGLDRAETNPLATVRFALSGSAPLPEELVARFADIGIPLHEGYGLSETAPVLTLNAVDASGRARIGRPSPGSIGVAIPGVALELRDTDGEPAEIDDPGHITVRGANLFSGYWPDGADGPSADGWFDTGDVAYAGADGQLVLVGRDTELILVNGFNVYPAEVEEVLRGATGLADVAVVGRPDARTGEAVVAYVVPEHGSHLDVAALLAEAARSLARFKLPTQIEVVAELPLTITGKVKKWQLGPAGPGAGERSGPGERNGPGAEAVSGPGHE
jgi:long-chain acyl-CoA synthetase